MMLYFNHSSKMDVMLGVTVLGAGQAFAMVSSINIVIVSTPMLETGISTAVNTIIRTAGSVVGPAIAAVIISQNSHFDPVVGQAVPGDIAYQTIFLMASVVMALGVFLSLFIQNQKFTSQASMEGGPLGRKHL
jgi:MFS family permease